MNKKEQISYQNNYNRIHYARLSVNIDIDKKDEIEKHWRGKGFNSFTEYVKYLIKLDMDR